MSCSNCFNGCTEITSDKCIKYTGPSITSLGINKGDTLLAVENVITTYLLTALDGTGIKPFINPSSLCELVSSFLPTSGDITLIHIIDALIKSICSLQTQVENIADNVAVIEGEYTTDCLTGVTSTSGTHAILQATITKLCALEEDLGALALDVETNYVQVADINTYIEAFLISQGESTLIKTKMVPYAPMEYIGTVDNFDITGAGIGDWVDVYLCNGNNGTPDKRGRVTVGTTEGMGGGTFPSETDPSIAGNPTYELGTTGGTNTVTLSTAQIPSHTHTASASTEPDHAHDYTQYELDQEVASTGSGVRGLDKSNTQVPGFTTEPAGEHTHDITVASTGGGASHANIQPCIASHYIVYLP